MKILVAGNRKWKDLEAVKFLLQELKPTILVHGRELGACACAHFAAEDIGGIVIRPYPAGLQSRTERNQRIIEQEHTKREPIDICLAFPMRDSVNTWDMVERCLVAGIPVEMCVDDAPCKKKFEAVVKAHNARKR